MERASPLFSPVSRIMDCASDELGHLVLPHDATRALSLADALAAWVPPQSVSGLVRALDRHRDVNVNHLKRVHRSAVQPVDQVMQVVQDKVPPRIAVLLCMGGAENISSEVESLLSACDAKPCPIQVPAHGPLTRQQFDEWNAVWPVHFHPAAAMRNLAVFTTALTEYEEASLRKYMRRAIALAEENAAAGGRAIAAVIVRRAGEGDGSEDCELAACADACWQPAATSEDTGGATSAHQRHCHHPLRHAVMRCIEEVARLERAAAASKLARTLPLDVDLPEGGDVAASPHDARMPSRPAHHLCAGCDVYLTMEPCAMCAMALVHSRVRRVIYALPATGGGALGSRYVLHTERSVNHHFSVVRGALRSEAVRAACLVTTAAACANVGG